MSHSQKLPVAYSSLSGRERRGVRLRYIEVQDGECWHCKGNLNEDPPEHILRQEINWSLFPKGFLTHPIHLHHDHDTDMTLGAVHAYCNAVLWVYFGQ